MDLSFTYTCLYLVDLSGIQFGDVENLLGILEAEVQEVAADFLACSKNKWHLDGCTYCPRA